jgi:hypothetical protein
MTFTMPADRSHWHKFTGKIARVVDRGIGVQFDSKLSRYHEEIIRNLL